MPNKPFTKLAVGKALCWECISKILTRSLDPHGGKTGQNRSKMHDFQCF